MKSSPSPPPLQGIGALLRALPVLRKGKCPGVKRKGLLPGEETGEVETYKFLAKLCFDWLLSITKKSLVEIP